MDPQTGTRIKLKHFIHCRTTIVVFAITCACDKIYVGQTKIQRHLFDISLARQDESQENRTLTSVASHFLHHHHGKPEGFKVIGLDHIKSLISEGATLCLFYLEVNLVGSIDLIAWYRLG